jgi:hypothetical protein
MHSQNYKLTLLTFELIFVGNLIERFLHGLRWQDGAQEAVDQIRELLTSFNKTHQNDPQEVKNVIEKWNQMSKYVKQKGAKTKFSLKQDDPEWFHGIIL